MATIKDVAKLAGVSHGTVSNVVNGTKSVNSDIVKRVQQAIKELNFQPNIKARSLRISKTGMIGVVLPNIADSIYRNLYNGIERMLRSTDYTPLLVLTDDKVESEKNVLDKLRQQRVEAIVIITCMPYETAIFAQLMDEGIKLLFVRRRPVDCETCYFIGLDEAVIIRNTVEFLAGQGKRSFLLLTDKSSYSNEAEIIREFKAALTHSGAEWGPEWIRNANGGKEDVFRFCVEAIRSQSVPEVILTTCCEFAKMATAAVNFCLAQDEEAPLVIALASDSWYEHYANTKTFSGHYNFVDVGAMVGRKIISMLACADPYERLSEIAPLSKVSLPLPLLGSEPSAERETRLKICLLESKAAQALNAVGLRYKNLTGVDLDIHTFSYEELNRRMMMIGLMEDYDIVQINVPWLSEGARNHFFEDLSKYFNVLNLDYPQEVLDCYAIKDHEQFAIPYVLGAQILFYRKDLFSDLHYQRLYYETHHQELQPPRTWAEFDKVAQFFTQSLNPKSPVKYGIATSAHATDALYMFVPRLWEQQGSIFNALGELVFDTPKSDRALESLKASLQFTAPDALEQDLNAQAQVFFQGQAAMLVAYQSHLMDYQNDADSVYAGKIGIAAAPGQMTVRGGWALTINAQSEKKAASAAFLKWFCSPENIIPYNVLGGSNPGNAMLESQEIAIDFPWFALACKMMGRSRPMISVNAPLQQATFEGVAARVIEEYLKDRISARQAVERICELLTSLSLKVHMK